MSLKINKKWIKASIVIILAIILYIALYGPIVSICEKTEIGKVAYLMYEPVEFLRCNSKPIYILTEKLYELSGGEVAPRKRYLFKTKRRYLGMNGLGTGYTVTKVHPTAFDEVYSMVFDGTYIDEKECGIQTWEYQTGQKTQFDFKNGIITRITVFYKTGEILCDLYFNEGKIADGTYEWKIMGHQIAKCQFKNGLPYNGKAIFHDNNRLDNCMYSNFSYFMYNPEFNTAKNALVTFKNGKLIKAEDIILFANGMYYIGKEQFNYSKSPEEVK